MLNRFCKSLLLAITAISASLAGWSEIASAGQVLIADRTENAIYAYTNNGQFIKRIIKDDTNLSGPAGIQISPDQTKVYVASSLNSQVVQYDYDRLAGTMTNPVIWADSSDGLAFPNSVLFSQDGSKVYVSNLGNTGVAQFNPDGSSAGSPINGLIGGGAIFQYSGLAFAPGGELLVGGFQDFPAATSGAVAKSDAGITGIADFIGPNAALNGAATLLVKGNDLYVTAGFAGTVTKYNATTGVLSAGFGPIDDLIFPAGLLDGPNGDGFLVGALGANDGEGGVIHYDYDGNLIGTWALHATDGALGFVEATALVQVVPEPSSIAMLGMGLGLVGFVTRRRLRSQG